MSRTVKIINVIAFCIWIALIAILLYKNYAGIPLDKAQALEQSFSREAYWYDIYAGTKR